MKGLSFGTRVRNLRKQQRISQLELGQRSRIPQTTISDWENGKSFPDINEAVRIAQALGVTVNDLLEETIKTK